MPLRKKPVRASPGLKNKQARVPKPAESRLVLLDELSQIARRREEIDSILKSLPSEKIARGFHSELIILSEREKLLRKSLAPKK